MTYGVGATGFTYPDLDVIVADIGASLAASLGAGINLVAPSVFSQIVGIMADREFPLWQAAAAVYASQYPSTAADQSLDNVCSITGIVRLQPTKGTVTLTVNLNAGVTLPAGKIASAGANGAKWVTTASATNSGGAAADVTVAAEAANAGVVPGLAGTIVTIVTSYSGWNSVTNVSDAAVGRALETDADLRLRRLAALSAQGSSSVDALRSALLQMDGSVVGAGDGILACNVFRNVTEVTDSDGVPAHAVECVVQANTATDAQIRAVIWANLAAGIRAYGTTTGTVVDSQGFSQEVDFTHAAEVPIYVIVNLTKNADYDSDAAVKTALAAYINALILGEDVVDTQLYAPIFACGGVVDVTKLWSSATNPPTSPGNVTITSRQKATSLTANITVVAT